MTAWNCSAFLLHVSILILMGLLQVLVSHIIEGDILPFVRQQVLLRVTVHQKIST
jgi:hypothetical protein